MIRNLRQMGKHFLARKNLNLDHKVKHLFFSFKKPVLERNGNKGGKISLLSPPNGQQDWGAGLGRDWKGQKTLGSGFSQTGCLQLKAVLFPTTAYLSQVMQAAITMAIMHSDPRACALTTAGWASPLPQALRTRRQGSGE